jgi:ACS family hexuronate transporter-like MFS transporter
VTIPRDQPLPATEKDFLPDESRAAGSRPVYKWLICGLLFLVTANNYFDRQVLGVLAPEILRRFHWQARQYADIVTWFDVAYGIGFLFAGRLLDILGTRLGFAIAATAWSLAAMAHGAVASLIGLKLVRSLLGLSESSHLPAAIKSIAEWFPADERALATGIYKAGGEIGALTVPALIPWLYLALGWRWVFVLTGSTGLIWVGLWMRFNRTAAGTAAPGSRPRGGRPRGLTPWRALLRRPETYGYIAAKFLTDAVWHWYLYLLPLFLSVQFKLSIRQFGLPLVAVYALSDTGSIGGGWLSSHLMKRGWTVTAARKLAMLICCCCVLPVVFAPHVDGVWIAVVLVGTAMAAHQGWTSNLFTTVSDLYPLEAVGSVVGVGGAAGMAGAALLAQLTGHLLATTGNYSAIFLIAGTAYLGAFALFHFLAPSLDPLPLANHPAE